MGPFNIGQALVVPTDLRTIIINGLGYFRDRSS